MRRKLLGFRMMGVACTLLMSVVAARGAEPAVAWPSLGDDAGSQHYSPLSDIRRDNVAKLQVAWTYRNGDFSKGGDGHGGTAFQVTPLMVDDSIYFCTPYSRVIALDAETGRERWRFDPKTKLEGVYTPVCRGVALWRDTQTAADAPCRTRIYTGTVDASLWAVDAKTGLACSDFGEQGRVDLKRGLGELRRAEYYPTSAPLVIAGVVVIGAFVRDNQRLHAPAGGLRAFDARSGKLRWVWDAAPPSMKSVTAAEVEAGATLTRGTPNVWAPLSADTEHGLIYAPTGNPSPDHYGGAERGNMDFYGSSIVALDAATGSVRWHFQTVHHDLWDYDVAPQPVLFEQRMADGRRIPALAQATKVGLVYVLDRLTGKPLFPVEERPVPPSTVPGETASPTQPFPTKPAPLAPLTLTRDKIWGFTPIDRNNCLSQFDALDYRGLYTPPSLKGTLEYPGLGGGANWGSASIDPIRNRMIINMQVAPFTIKLVPRKDAVHKTAAEAGDGDLVNFGAQEDTPYVVERGPYLSKWMTPCVAPPWGRLIAIDLGTGDKLWEHPLGTLHGLAPLVGDYLHYGTPNSGGSLQTAGGLAFIGATMDKYFHAYDADSGEELWRYELPYAGTATPMSYRATAGGRQFVLIAAGGHAPLGVEPGDALVAFALPAAAP